MRSPKATDQELIQEAKAKQIDPDDVSTWTEADRVRLYWQRMREGLSDYESRAEAWPEPTP